MICPSNFLAPPATVAPELSQSATKFFTKVVSHTCDIQLSQFPPHTFKGGMSIKTSQGEYKIGIGECKRTLHGRLTLQKGDPPLATRDLHKKLSNLLEEIKNWKIISLGKGFLEFKFISVEDMCRVRSLGLVNLNPNLLQFSSWSRNFDPKIKSKHTHVWVRLIGLPQD